MRTTSTLAVLGWAAWIALAAPLAWAGDGHDHGEAPAASAGPASPRFAATSETFELVGVVNGRQLTLYVDRYADGSPVKDAKLELELGGVRVPVEAHGEGEFAATLAQELEPGVVSVAATIIAGKDSDLLAGELDIHDEAHAEEAAHTHGWQEYALGAGAAGAALLFLGALWHRRRAARNLHIGGAA
jgi:hypothetical protein